MHPWCRFSLSSHMHIFGRWIWNKTNLSVQWIHQGKKFSWTFFWQSWNLRSPISCSQGWKIRCFITGSQPAPQFNSCWDIFFSRLYIYAYCIYMRRNAPKTVFLQRLKWNPVTKLVILWKLNLEKLQEQNVQNRKILKIMSTIVPSKIYFHFFCAWLRKKLMIIRLKVVQRKKRSLGQTKLRAEAITFRTKVFYFPKN